MLYCDTPARLKALMPGQILAVASAEARRARDVVAECAGVKDAILMGDSVHAVVDDAERREGQLAAAATWPLASDDHLVLAKLSLTFNFQGDGRARRARSWSWRYRQ